MMSSFEAWNDATHKSKHSYREFSLQAETHSTSQKRLISCTACRQVKLKCDAKHNFPAPCTRCKRNNLDCVMDANFKRTPTRRRLEEVTSKLTALEKAIEDDHQVNSLVRNSKDGLPWRPEEVRQLESEPFDTAKRASPSSDASGKSGTPNSASWIDSFESQSFPVHCWSLGGVAVSWETTTDLFKVFELHCFRHVPVLERSPSILAVYEASEFLFWTIVCTACKRYTKYSHLSLQLIGPYRDLLGTVLGKPIKQIETIHALLILCLWPISVSWEPGDSSWNYCGLAINAAMQMSLHRTRRLHEPPKYSQPPTIQTSVEVCAMTWMACFQISTNLSSFMGLLPQISSASQLANIASLINDPGVPRAFAASTEIQFHVARYMVATESIPESRTLRSLIPLFEQDLENVRSKYQDVWSKGIDIDLQNAKVHLYALSFISEESSLLPPLGPFDTSYKVLLLSGLAAAVRLIYLCSEVHTLFEGRATNETENPSKASVKYFPKIYKKNLFFASVFLLKFLAIDIGATQWDKELAQNHVMLAYKMFTSTNRGAKPAQAIELLCRMPRTEGAQSRLHVNDRFGASLIYDALIEFDKMGSNMAGVCNIAPCTVDQRGDDLGSSGAASSAVLGASTTESPIIIGIGPELMDPQISSQVSDFPWGVWDNALYDSMLLGEGMDFNLNLDELLR